MKGASNGAKYKQIIEDSLLHSAKHLGRVHQPIFYSNWPESIQYNEIDTGMSGEQKQEKPWKSFDLDPAEKLWYHVILAVY